MYQQQWELGEAAGIEVFMGLPKTLIEGATAIIKEHQGANETKSEK